MEYDLNKIYGVYEMHKIESTLNGEPTTERSKSGMFVFTRDDRLAVVSGSNEWVMAYSGSFEIKEDTLFIYTESCNVREKEDKTMTRKILKLDGVWLALEAKNSELGTRSEITWKKKLSF
jgi:hypothetical protein